MKLTDQEQVVLKAVGHGVREVSQVIRAVGYPKATTKKVLARLNDKGVITVYRHDYPQSLTPAQRKLMLRLKDGQGNWHYYNAVSMRKRNPKKSKSKTALKRTGRALRGLARGALSAGSEILGAGAMALNPNNEAAREMLTKLKRAGIPVKDVTVLGSFVHLHMSSAAGANKAASMLHSAGFETKIKSPRETYKREWLVIGKARRNPSKRIKIRNKYIDLVIKGQAKKTPDGWRVGKKTFAQGRGTVSVSSGYYLDRSTGMVYAKRERNVATKHTAYYKAQQADTAWQRELERVYGRSAGDARYDSRGISTPKLKKLHAAFRKASNALNRHRNAQQGFYDSSGFHPIRASSDYDSRTAGETGSKSVRTRSKKKISAKRKASSTARSRVRVRSRKTTTSRLAGRAIKKSAGLLKKRGRKNPITHKSWRSVYLEEYEPALRKFFPVAERTAKTEIDLKRILAEAKKKKYRATILVRGGGYPTIEERVFDFTKRRNPDVVAKTPYNLTLYGISYIEKLRDGKYAVEFNARGEYPSGYRAGLTLTQARARHASNLKKLRALAKTKRNPSAESIRKTFAGRHSKDSKLYFPDGTPTGLAKLGKLIKIDTKSGPIEPNNLKGEVWLCADTNKRFHLGSTIKAPLFDGPPRSFGEVKMIEYQESKPHLGYHKTIWFHEMGEEGGKRPTLHANNKGELKFKGGDYRITVRGIEN